MYIEIPPEDPEADPDDLGRLRLCLYGTRDAALNWQTTLSDHLVQNGFVTGVGYPLGISPSKEADLDVGPRRRLLQRRHCIEPGLDARYPLRTYKIKTQRIRDGVGGRQQRG